MRGDERVLTKSFEKISIPPTTYKAIARYIRENPELAWEDGVDEFARYTLRLLLDPIKKHYH